MLRNHHIAAFLALALIAACVPASIQTPAGKAAWEADQVVTSIDALSDVAIKLNATLDDKTGAPLLATETTRRVGIFAVAAVRVLKTAPAGWPVTVRAAYVQLVETLSAKELEKLGPYLAALASIIDSVAPTGGTP